MLSQDGLMTRLLSDLTRVKLPVEEVDLYIRPFSKTYYGRYFPVYNDNKLKPKIYIYPYENKEGDFMDYDQILKTAVHEFCHHIQYTNSSFVRNKGVMHDPQFWRLYNHYVERAEKYRLIGGVPSEKKVKTLCY